MPITAPSLRARAARGVRWTFAASVATAGTQAVQLLVLGRLLSPRDFGVMGALAIVIGFALAYTDLGISAAVVQRHDATPHQLSTLYWLNVLAGALVAVAVVAAAPLVARFFHDPALVAPLRTTSALFLLAALGKQFEMLLQRDLAFDTLARIEVLAALTGTATAVVGAVAGLRFWALVAGALASAAVRAAQLVALGFQRFRPSLRFRWSDTRGFVAFGAYQIAEQSINYFGERLDQLLIGRLVGLAPLGYYNFGFNLTSHPISRINPMVTRVAFPTFCAIQHDRVRLRDGYLRVTHLLSAVNAPTLLGLAATAPVLVPLVFGAQWIPSVPLIRLLCIVALLRCAANPLGSLLLAVGRADIGFRFNVVFIALNVPALLIGARLGGARGIAIGLIVVQLVLAIVGYLAILRKTLGPCAPAYTRAVLKPVALATLMALAVAAVPDALPASPPVIMLAAQVVVGAAVYGLALITADRGTLQQFATVALARAS